MVAQGNHLMPVNQELGNVPEARDSSEITQKGGEVRDTEKLKTRRLWSTRGISEFCDPQGGAAPRKDKF